MDAGRAAGGSLIAGRFDGLHAEAKAALAYSANSLRAVRDHYREAYLEQLARWQDLRDALDRAERRPMPRSPASTGGDGPADAATAEESADEIRLRTLRNDVDDVGAELAAHQAELAKLEIVLRSLEASWLFLEPGDTSLIADQSLAASAADVQMRLVEAQESERGRLAQEIHDGPAQALSNAIFQVEFIERVLEPDPALARTELALLRQLLRRELGEVRTYVSQLRRPLLDELGFDGAIREMISEISATAAIPIDADLRGSGDRLDDARQTVVLRVLQESLQNVRKHAAAASATVATWEDDGNWLLEVRDDGRGFDIAAVVARGRRNFGLQFMRERAELIGATYEVRSRPDGGTVVSLAIPVGGKESR